MSAELFFNIGLVFLTLVAVMAFMRLTIGPSLPDRVVASDLLSTTVIAVIAVYAMATNQPALLDAALVVALLSFLGTVAFAYYIDRRQ